MNQVAKQPKPKHQWLRFNLRTFLVVATILSVCIGSYLHRVDQQRKGVAWVLRNGGEVHYFYAYIENNKYNAEPVPEWLLKIVDIHHFLSVEQVILYDSRTSDLAPLTQIKNLRSLVLCKTETSDFSPLARLSRLETLVVWILNEKKSNRLESLESLARLQRLTELRIHDPWFNREEITTLREALPNCKVRN